MPRERPEEIFLSHSSADHDFALRLSRRVRAHGIPVWFSQTDIAGSQQWQNEIGLALERCDWFAMQERKFKGKIVPILLSDCDPRELSWVLPSLQNVDFRGDFAEGCRDLMKIWGVGYRSD